MKVGNGRRNWTRKCAGETVLDDEYHQPWGKWRSSAPVGSPAPHHVKKGAPVKCFLLFLKRNEWVETPSLPFEDVQNHNRGSGWAVTPSGGVIPRSTVRILFPTASRTGPHQAYFEHPGV